MGKLLASALVLILPSMALAYSSGPPNGVIGAPGEGTCVGSGVPSDIYFYRLIFDGRTHSQKMTLLK